MCHHHPKMKKQNLLNFPFKAVVVGVGGMREGK
jgi:hypothetical protein